MTRHPHPPRSLFHWIAIVAVTAAAGGCHTTASSPGPTTPALPTATVAGPTTMPTTVAAPPQVFDDPTDGIRLSYPAGWATGSAAAPTTDASPKLRVVAPPDLTGGGSAVLSLNVPQLPPHIPGLIPIGLVANGYVSDVRKRMADVTGSPTEVAVPGAQARRVALSGHDGQGTPGSDDAVLIVHGDRVYILSADADPAGRQAADAALDAAVASIRWTP